MLIFSVTLSSLKQYYFTDLADNKYFVECQSFAAKICIMYIENKLKRLIKNIMLSG